MQLTRIKFIILTVRGGTFNPCYSIVFPNKMRLQSARIQLQVKNDFNRISVIDNQVHFKGKKYYFDSLDGSGKTTVNMDLNAEALKRKLENSECVALLQGFHSRLFDCLGPLLAELESQEFRYSYGFDADI